VTGASLFEDPNLQGNAPMDSFEWTYDREGLIFHNCISNIAVKIRNSNRVYIRKRFGSRNCKKKWLTTSRTYEELELLRGRGKAHPTKEGINQIGRGDDTFRAKL
jgi:hypothetical protein